MKTLTLSLFFPSLPGTVWWALGFLCAAGYGKGQQISLLYTSGRHGYRLDLSPASGYVQYVFLHFSHGI